MKNFTFDGTYGVDSNTASIYDDIAYNLVEGVIEGYNGTVFAYGQTGCGKSFTMQESVTIYRPRPRSAVHRTAWTLLDRRMTLMITDKGHPITTWSNSEIISAHFRIDIRCRKYKISCSCIVFGNLQ